MKFDEKMGIVCVERLESTYDDKYEKKGELRESESKSRPGRRRQAR